MVSVPLFGRDSGVSSTADEGEVDHIVKAVILAGGLGTRISEETHLKPKPMIEVGGKPLLWHICSDDIDAYLATEPPTTVQ